MLRRSELRRYTPLKSQGGVRTPVKRTEPSPVADAPDPALPKQPPSKMGKPIPLKVRRAVKERAGGRCEACGYIADPPHLHHRLTRGRGGQHTEDNLVALCPLCHDRIHGNPDMAYAHGLLVRSGNDPAAVEVVPW